MLSYDLLIKGALVVDVKNDIEDYMDIGVKNGVITQINKEISGKAKKVLNIKGKVLLPGIVDAHVHVSSLLGGAEGFKMMAKAGVTTAVDLAGPIESVIDYMTQFGAGLNISCLESVRPGYNLEANAARDEIERVVEDALKKGAVGIKIMGGHYPLSPETTATVIKCCNEKKVAVAFHSGSLATKSDLEGFKESVHLSKGNRVHIPHINSYCRGLVKEPLLEMAEIFELLEVNPNIVSCSYLAKINGTSGECLKDKPISEVTQNCLKSRGYTTTKEGLRDAILDGYAKVSLKEDGEIKIISGQRGLDYWENKNTKVTVSFPVNIPAITMSCATFKNKAEKFVVDILSTDGGGIPRNVSLQNAILLVKLGALTLKEMVQKMCYVPAQFYGFKKKGFIEEGADADFTVIDFEKGQPYMAIVNGELIMLDGIVLGEKGVLYTSEHAKINGGISTAVANIKEGFYNFRNKDD